MHTLLRISEAAAIAIHAVDAIAANGDTLATTPRLARTLGVSPNHLSKILQQLTRAGFAEPVRGPAGGFRLTKKAGAASLKDIFEAIEGKQEFQHCFMGSYKCGRRDCPFKRLLKETADKFNKALSVKVSDFIKNRRRSI